MVTVLIFVTPLIYYLGPRQVNLNWIELLMEITFCQAICIIVTTSKAFLEWYNFEFSTQFCFIFGKKTAAVLNDVIIDMLYTSKKPKLFKQASIVVVLGR